MMAPKRPKNHPKRHFSYLFSHKALEPEAEFAEVAEDTGADAETMLRG